MSKTARKSKEWTDTKLKTRINQGRGQGEEEYQPWLKVADIPSRGRVTRLFSRKMNRTIHLFSDLQTMHYYQLEFDHRVQFVKEQYPLLDLVDIVGKLDEPLLKRLKNSDGTPHIIITTFLISAKDDNGNLFTYARSIKAGAEIEKKSVLERLEIQRQYYSSLNVDWAVITEKEINYARGRNIEWALPALNTSDYGLTEEEVKRNSVNLIDALQNNPKNPVKNQIESFEREYRLNPGTGMFLFRYLIASKQIEVNMDVQINVHESPQMMSLTAR